MNFAFALLQKPLAIALILGALIAFIYFKGKANANEAALYGNPLPNSGSGIPSIGIGPNGQQIPWSPTPIANELYNALNGVATMAYTKELVFKKLEVLTNDQLTALYNKFNQLYYGKGNGTLTQWLEDEYNVTLFSTRDDLVSRLQNLNLR